MFDVFRSGDCEAMLSLMLRKELSTISTQNVFKIRENLSQ